ncbi:hypothetical protein ACFL1R_01380 [Candidatus Latescibacterota bacterium]
MKNSAIAYSTCFMVICLLMALVLGFSCSDSGDKRKMVKDDYGEPDYIEEGQYGAIKLMRYVYASRNINKVYEFRKSAGGCGGSGNWYVDRIYYAESFGYPLYTVPIMTHNPIESSPAGVDIPLSTEIIDSDDLLESVTIYHRTAGQDEFNTVVMSFDEGNKYIARIPDVSVTAEGIEYYIELTYTIDFYEKTRFLQLPESGFYSVSIAAAAGRVVKGAAETVHKSVSPSTFPEPDEILEGISPVSP